MNTLNRDIPIIDISDFNMSLERRKKIAFSLRQALVHTGFFYIRGHNVEVSLQNEIEHFAKIFFALPLEEKMSLHMSLGGKAWRGYFPVGEELTSGKPDQKEGLYFGQQLESSHPKVQMNTPLHGSNLFPDIPNFKETILSYISELTRLGSDLMRLISLSLDLDEHYLNHVVTRDPLILFRIFHYPSQQMHQQNQELWGVGEHTDYGLITILKQDDCGGLEILKKQTWVQAPYIENTFICNVGDMLEHITGGTYRSTLHRVRNKSNRSRYSFPFFFDPNFETRIQILPGCQKPVISDSNRWDNASPHDFTGTYGDYILKKVAKVFPKLQ